MVSRKVMMVFLLLTFILSVNRKGCALALTFEVFPKTLNHNGDVVTLHWKGLDSPSSFDWIGVYTPPNSDDNHYIGYILLSTCPEWIHGTCTFNMSLLNLHKDYQFRLFREESVKITKETPMDEDHNPLPNTTHRLAVSENIRFKNVNEPTQIHLSLTSISTEMRVMFVIRDPIKSFVKYGLKKDSLDSIAETTFATYQKSDMCDAPANTSLGWRDPGFIHDVVMDNLAPGRIYFYQVGSDEGGWSELYSFTSGDANSDETHAFLFGDMGTWFPYHTFLRTQEESLNTVKWLKRDLDKLGGTPALISHIGDISYARGYAWLWDAFFTQIEPIAARAPYHVCIGNHEYDWPSQPWKPSWAEHDYGTDGGGECGIPYSTRFHMPGNSTLSTGVGSVVTRNLYYSLNLGVVHFLYFSTETNFLPGSDQYTFLVQDLKTVNRDKTPFVLVLGHRPMYTSEYESPLLSQIRDHLEPLLVEYKVNLALWGHVHKYERTCSMQNYVCRDSNSGMTLPIHVVIGMGGKDSQPHWIPRPHHEKDPIFPQPIWSLYRSGELGYTRLYASRFNLTLSYIGNHDGKVHDIVTIPSMISATDSLSKRCNIGDWPCNWLVNSLCLVLVASIGMLLGFALAYFVGNRKSEDPRDRFTSMTQIYEKIGNIAEPTMIETS